MIWGLLVEMGGREVQPGTIGLAVSAITGPPTLLWAAISGDFFPVFSGACMGIAGLGWWIYTQPENRATKALAETTAELARLRRAQEEADKQAIAERGKLRRENEELRVQLARLMAEVKKVGLAVANPVIVVTPDPDHPSPEPE